MSDGAINVPAETTPSLWNDYLYEGAKIGALPAAAAVGLGVGVPTLSVLAALGVVGGGVAGAFYGKSEMEKESSKGKTFYPPSIFNRGALSGALTASIVGVALMSLVYAFSASLTGFAFPLVAGMAIAGVAGYAYMQGKVHMETQQRQYDTAKSLAVSTEPDIATPAKAATVTVSSPAVTKQDLIELEARLKQGQSGSRTAVETLLNQRAAAQIAPSEVAR